MKELVQAMSGYIHILVLGALCGGLILASLHPSAVLRNVYDWALEGMSRGGSQAGGEERKGAGAFLLVGGVIFSACYTAGYCTNATGRFLLHRAHYRIISDAATFAQKNQQIGPADHREQFEIFKWSISCPAGNGMESESVVWTYLFWAYSDEGFSKAPIPSECEKIKYRLDSIMQTRWQICDKESFKEWRTGPQLIQAQIIRCLVATAYIVFALSMARVFLFMGLNFVAGNLGYSLPEASGLRRHMVFPFWPAIFMLASFLAFRFLLLPAYWDAELDLHTTVWGLFTNPTQGASLPCAEISPLKPAKH